MLRPPLPTCRLRGPSCSPAPPSSSGPAARTSRDVGLRRRPAPEGARFLVVTSLLLVPLVFVPLYPQLLLVVVPFLALAAAHPALPRPWRWLALTVTASVVIVRWQAMPAGETPSRAEQQATIQWMLEQTSRETPVVEVWPTDCPAFVFQQDPGWQWMLAANDAYTPGLQRFRELTRLCSREVTHPGRSLWCRWAERGARRAESHRAV